MTVHVDCGFHDDGTDFVFGHGRNLLIAQRRRGAEKITKGFKSISFFPAPPRLCASNRFPPTLGGYRALRFPLPIRELLAEGDFLEFADGGARDGVEEDEGVGELPLGKRGGEERAQFF